MTCNGPLGSGQLGTVPRRSRCSPLLLPRRADQAVTCNGALGSGRENDGQSIQLAGVFLYNVTG